MQLSRKTQNSGRLEKNQIYGRERSPLCLCQKVNSSKTSSQIPAKTLYINTKQKLKPLPPHQPGYFHLGGAPPYFLVRNKSDKLGNLPTGELKFQF